MNRDLFKDLGTKSFIIQSVDVLLSQFIDMIKVSSFVRFFKFKYHLVIVSVSRLFCSIHQKKVAIYITATTYFYILLFFHQNINTTYQGEKSLK